jgi:hypothetical protein
MDNFDLRKYLTENKVTTNSKVLTENQDPEWLEGLRIKLKRFLEGHAVNAMAQYDNNMLEIRVDSPNMMKSPALGPLIAKEVSDVLNEIRDEYNVEFKYVMSNMEDFDAAHTENNTSAFRRAGYELSFVYRVES